VKRGVVGGAKTWGQTALSARRRVDACFRERRWTPWDRVVSPHVFARCGVAGPKGCYDVRARDEVRRLKPTLQAEARATLETGLSTLRATVGMKTPPRKGGCRQNWRPHKTRGITLIEMLIAMAIIALIAGLSYPSLAAGLDTLRLRSTSDAIIGFLNTALARADTRQQVVEIVISPTDGTLTANSGDHGFSKRLEIQSPIKILSVRPGLADAEEQGQTRRFLVYPGGSVPKIAIEIGNSGGRKRLVSIDPITGVPQSVVVKTL